MKKAVSLVLIIALLFSGIVIVAPSANAYDFDDDDILRRTIDGWYEVYTAYQLEYVLSLNNNIDIRLMNDITFKPSDFYHSGDFYGGFASGFIANNHGVFDGCGHSINNAEMYSFFVNNYGTIKNVTLNNCRISVIGLRSSFCDYNYGTIENCRLLYSNSIDFVSENEAGGIVKNCVLDDGVNSANPQQGTYSYSFTSNKGTIDGFVNYANDCFIKENYGTVKNYINFGNNDLAGVSKINRSTITCCANYGDISSNTGNGVYGIASSGLLTNCINYGNIKSTKYDNVYGIGVSADYCINLGKLETSKTVYQTAIYPNACYYFDENSTAPGTVNSATVALESSYPELDFVNIWEIRDGKPHLKMDAERIIAVTPYYYPEKTTYFQYEDIDFSDMVLMVCNNYGEWELRDDFTISGSTQKLGKSVVTVTCKGVSCEIPILVFGDMSKATVKLAQSSFVYDGTQKKPTLIIKDENSKILSPNTDYELTYTNNINAGTALVTIEGKGFYYGTIYSQFVITPCPINTANVRLNTTSYWYDGKAKTPAASITGVTGTLVLNNDYTVSYANNVNPGTATATITGKGNYSGTFKRNFQIKVPTVTGVSAYNVSNKSISLKCKALSGVSGYEFQFYNANTKKWVTKARTAKNYATVSKLAQGKLYAFRVRAYKQVGTKKYYGAYSSTLKAKTVPYKVTGLKKDYCYNTYGMWYENKISWSRQPGVSGYQIYFSNTGAKVTKKGANNNSHIYNFNPMGRNSAYATLCVRSYKVVNGKVIYGAWSSRIYM